MDLPNPQCIVCFPEKYTNMIPAENKRPSLHPRPVPESAGRLLPAPHCFFKEAERKSRSRDAALRLHLMLRREGGRRGRRGREGRKKKLKETFFFFFFFTCDKSCSHMGGTRPSDLTKGWIGWSQWSIGWGGVLPGGRRAAGGGQPQSMGLWADCDGISSTALYNGFLGVAALSPQHLQPFDFPAQWSVNTRTELHLHVQCMHPSSACAPWHISDVI